MRSFNALTHVNSCICKHTHVYKYPKKMLILPAIPHRNQVKTNQLDCLMPLMFFFHAHYALWVVKMPATACVACKLSHKSMLLFIASATLEVIASQFMSLFLCGIRLIMIAISNVQSFGRNQVRSQRVNWTLEIKLLFSNYCRLCKQINLTTK